MLLVEALKKHCNIYCICLEECNDRYESACKEFDKIGLKDFVYFHRPKYHEKGGIYGNFESMLWCLNNSLNKDPSKLILILEDDIFFSVNRFLNTSFLRTSNFTTGQVYSSVIERERSGGYLGQTIQVVPHIVGEIVDRIKKAGEGHDILVVELGGTVGDIEGLPYMEAIRMMKVQSPQGGRIINNGSISATTPRPHSIAYTATKHAVSGLTKAASLDGRRYDIAVGQIDVGNAATPLASRMAKGVLQANGETKAEPLMDVAVVGQSVLYMANLPLECNVMFHTVMATKMPFAGRG